MSDPGRPGKTAALLVGGAVSFVVGVSLLQAIRPALLLDPEPAWLVPRFLLWIGLLSAAASAGTLAAALFLLWSRSRFAPDHPKPLPFRPATIGLLAAAAFVAGAVLRFAGLETIPLPLWLDDVSLIEPALALEGHWRDFRDSIRPAPYGVEEPYGSVGVLYLELYRLALRLFGATVFGVRVVSAAAGVLSIVTAMLLGRELLPRGGGMLAGLALAGLRWNLLLSRWAWNAIVLAPVADVAALLLLRARRRGSLWLAAVSGLAAGLCAHIYLAGWVVAGALAILAAWPSERNSPVPSRFGLPVVFVAAFAFTVAPLFLLDEGRSGPYFARASDHNLLREIEYMHSPIPGFAAIADSLSAPWLGMEPYAHHDLPGKTRLGWLLGSVVAVAFARAILRPREPFSAFLLAHAAAGLAASVLGGNAGLPNSYRFGYLSTATAVAVSGGILSVLGKLSPWRRRAAAIAAVGLVAISGSLAARDALVRWPERRETFDEFHGQDTLIARATMRWERYGDVERNPALQHSSITVDAIRRYRLDPNRPPVPGSRERSGREFRIVAPGESARDRERLVERVGDPWGREWAWVYGRRRSEAPA